MMSRTKLDKLPVLEDLDSKQTKGIQAGSVRHNEYFIADSFSFGAERISTDGIVGSNTWSAINKK